MALRRTQTRMRASRLMRRQTKALIGINTEVVVKKPGEIPRSQGKAVRVRDLRPKNA